MEIEKNENSLSLKDINAKTNRNLISRSDFLRFSLIMGASAVAASMRAGNSPEEPEPNKKGFNRIRSTAEISRLEMHYPEIDPNLLKLRNIVNTDLSTTDIFNFTNLEVVPGQVKNMMIFYEDLLSHYKHTYNYREGEYFQMFPNIDNTEHLMFIAPDKFQKPSWMNGLGVGTAIPDSIGFPTRTYISVPDGEDIDRIMATSISISIEAFNSSSRITTNGSRKMLLPEIVGNSIGIMYFYKQNGLKNDEATNHFAGWKLSYDNENYDFYFNQAIYNQIPLVGLPVSKQNLRESIG